MSAFQTEYLVILSLYIWPSIHSIFSSELERSKHEANIQQQREMGGEAERFIFQREANTRQPFGGDTHT